MHGIVQIPGHHRQPYPVLLPLDIVYKRMAERKRVQQKASSSRFLPISEESQHPAVHGCFDLHSFSAGHKKNVSLSAHPFNIPSIRFLILFRKARKILEKIKYPQFIPNSVSLWPNKTLNQLVLIGIGASSNRQHVHHALLKPCDAVTPHPPEERLHGTEYSLQDYCDSLRVCEMNPMPIPTTCARLTLGGLAGTAADTGASTTAERDRRGT